MARIRAILIGGLAVAAVMIVALPAAQGIGAATKERPVVQVNRGAKGDRLVAPADHRGEESASRDRARNRPRTEPAGKRRIMDGCDPMFSPVTVPSMAHIAGRCVG